MSTALTMKPHAPFWDKLARRYAAQPIKDQAAYETTLERTRSYLGQEDKVLELGCGTGTTALILAEAVSDYTASDFSSGMIEVAEEKRVAQKAGNVTFRVAELGDHVAAGERYDAVMGFNFFHLVRDPEQAFMDVRSILKPGGIFISKTVCLKGKWYLRPVIWTMQRLGKAPFVGFLSAGDVENMIARAGFEILETGSYPSVSRFVVARKI